MTIRRIALLVLGGLLAAVAAGCIAAAYAADPPRREYIPTRDAAPSGYCPVHDGPLSHCPKLV